MSGDDDSQRILCSTCLSCMFAGDGSDGDTCPECGWLNPFQLQTSGEQEYLLVSCQHKRRVPVVPWFALPDWVKLLPQTQARQAIMSRTRYLGDGDLFLPLGAIPKTGRYTSIPWYRVVTSAQCTGWIDSVALVGWVLERV